MSHPTDSSTQPERVSASQVLGALSFALDLTDGQQMGHSMQSCLVGMRVGRALGLPAAQMSDLYYSLILKDAGCSSNSSRLYHLLADDEISAKRTLKRMDWTQGGWQGLRYALNHMATGLPLLQRVQHILRVARQPEESGALYALRCERGASIARRIGFSLEVAEAIASLDEHWDGLGYPMRLAGQQIPVLARIMNLAQTVAVFWCHGGAPAVTAMLRERSQRWFDPELVRIALLLCKDGSLCHGLGDADIVATAAGLEPEGLQLSFDAEGIDRISDAFAEVIDAKSPFTARHSAGVSKAAVAIAQHMGCDAATVAMLRRAGLLHDIGKLAVPNSILEKPGKLDSAEWRIVQQHPRYSLDILQRVPGFTRLSEIAASHHERLDGKGYFRGMGAAELDRECRILAAADVFDALAAERPYRAALPRDEVFAIMLRDTPHSLDIDCVQSLQQMRDEELMLAPIEAPEPLSRDQGFLPSLAPQFA